MDTFEATRVEPDVLVERARSLVPTVRELSDQTERDRRVSIDVVDAMREKKLFRLLQAERYGGFELDFGTGVKMIDEVGRGCASTAWVLGLYMIHQWLAAHFPIQAQDEIWGDDPDTVISGSYAMAGKCEAAEGGYRITGNWRYASGCDNAPWGLVSVMFPPAEGETPMPGFLVVGPGEFTLFDDWHTVGLAGTGSKAIVCEDQFVPIHRKVTFAELATGTSAGANAHDKPLYRIPLLAAVPAFIASPALGALNGAIDDFVAEAGVRETRGAVVAGGNRVGEFQAVQMRIGEAQACYNFGRTQILADLAETHRQADSGEPITVDQRIHNRLTQSFMVKLAVQGIEALYGATGGEGLQLSHRIQRAWRDIHAVSHHITFNWDAVSSMSGQQALGLEPKGQY